MKNRKLVVSILAGLLAAVMLLSLIISILPRNVSATTSGELKDQLEDLKGEMAALSDQMAQLERQQSDNLSDIYAIVAQKNVIDQQVALLHTQVNNLNGQISTYNLLIADKQEELEQAQARLAELNEKNKERIRAMEEEGELSYWSVLFKANSFSDLLDRLNMINEIAAADRRRLEEMSQVAQRIAAAQAELAAEKESLEASRMDLEDAQAELAEKQAASGDLLAELLAKGEELDELMEQFEQDESDFLLEIARKEQEYSQKLAEEEEASRQASIRASIEASIQESIQESIEQSIEASIQESVQASIEESRHEATRPTAGGSKDNPSGARWLVPCDYIFFSSPFGSRWHPITGKWTMHYGVDLAAPEGTPIYASRSGVVTIAKYSSTAGNYVTINHEDGYSSIYMHMTHYVVSAGDYVKAGQLIGYVGNTGASKGNHLHFGISYMGEYVNPAEYIDI